MTLNLFCVVLVLLVLFDDVRQVLFIFNPCSGIIGVV